MKIEPLGDSAYILRELDDEPYLIARALNLHPPKGLIEAVASYETVGLYVDPFSFDIDDIPARTSRDEPEMSGASHVIPVCYELGPDLSEAAAQLGMTASELVAHHSNRDYRCYALGFCPGFAYLGYLPEEIAGLPRLPNPRVSVEPGCVAITGRQTAVYPLERPGGWWLIGKTPLTLVAEDYFPIEAGDTVRFVPIDAAEYTEREGERL